MARMATATTAARAMSTTATLRTDASTSAVPQPTSSATTSSSATTQAPTVSQTEPSSTHFIVTLLRSPLHLPKAVKSTCTSLGLHKRLSTSIVPNTPQNVGYLLKVKELVTIRNIDALQGLGKSATKEWVDRQGQGRRGSGLRASGGPLSVIRVGSERARGDERGFRVVSRQ
ncbi:hypothetical protein OIO90_002540 [Microbotryomycetes sp. JL221]|nr:hypothetical protein OIO90_002540 [Microbotryomycetes sp. JL221]